MVGWWGGGVVRWCGVGVGGGVLFCAVGGVGCMVGLTIVLNSTNIWPELHSGAL